MQSDFCQSEHQPLKNDTGTQRKDANRVSIRGKRVRNNLQEGVQVKVTNNLQAYLAKLESQSKTLHVLQLHLCYMAASLFHFSCHLLSIQQFPKSLFLYFLLLILQYCTSFYLFSSHSFTTALSSFQLLESLFINSKGAEGAHGNILFKAIFPL